MAGIITIATSDLLSDSRADLNSNFTALVTLHGDGATSPSPTYSNMLWEDEDNNTLKKMNQANTAFFNVSDSGQSEAANLGLLPLSGGTLTGLITLSGAPTATLHAATKGYVDGLIVAQGSAPDTDFYWLKTVSLHASNPHNQTLIPLKYNSGTSLWESTVPGVIRATNGHTASVSAGDVLFKNTTDGEYDRPTLASQVADIAIALETIASGGDGLMAIQGGPYPVNCTGTPTAGQYLFTALDVLTATASGTKTDGAFGYVMFANSTTPDCILYGYTRG